MADEQLAELTEQVHLLVDALRARIAALSVWVDAMIDALERERPGPDDDARLLAVELAVNGATRADVGARLEQRFGTASTGELLDALFGVGSPPGARLSWGRG